VNATDPGTWFNKMRPEAERLRDLLGAGPNVVPVFLAQWAHETGFESPKWIGGNNYSGLTDGEQFRSFGSAKDHTRAQAAALQDPDWAWAYAPFVDAARQNDPPEQLAEYLGVTPWNEDHYQGDGNMPGGVLVGIMHDYGLLDPAKAPVEATASAQIGAAVTPGPGGKFVTAQTMPEFVTAQTMPESLAQPKTGDPWYKAVGGFFSRLNDTVFAWDWWKRLLWLLILLLVAVLLIYLSLRGMTTAPAEGE